MNNENLSEKDSNQLSIDELLEKEKNKGTLTQNELVSMIDDNECDLDQIDKLYEDLEILNLESADGGLEQNEFTEEIKNEIVRYGSAEDMEKMLASEGLAIDDPVRMYLKEIGRLMHLKLQRAELEKNDYGVFLECVNRLRESAGTKDTPEDIRAILEKKRSRKN